jgi:hypothetical protein
MKRSAGTVAVIADRRAHLLAALACVVGTLGLASASATAAPPGWSKPVSLAGSASEPGIALSGNGAAAAVWEASRGTFIVIEGSIRVGGKWTFTSVIAVGGFEPSIAPVGEGEAIAVWDGGWGVEAALATAGGWSSLPPIPHSVGAIAPEVATDSAGRATVVWREPGPGGMTIDVATRTPDGSCSAVRRLSQPGGIAYAPHVAVTPMGAAVAVWRRDDGGKSVVQAAVRAGEGRWSAPVSLSAKGENAVSPAVAIGSAGDAVAVWQRFDGHHQIIQASAHPAGGRWSRPVDLSAQGRNAEAPVVALSPAGEAVVVWERFDGRADLVQAASRGPGGRWARLRNLSNSRGSGHEPQVVIDDEGLVRVVWMSSEENGAAVEESSRPPAGRWSAPVQIAAGPTRRLEPAVDVGPGGEAIAAWGGYGMVAAFRPADPQ